MHSSRSIKYFFAFTILFASCRANRNVASFTNEEVKPTIAVAVSVHNSSQEITGAIAIEPISNIQDTAATVATEGPIQDVATSLTAAKTKRKITSFTQMKEMAQAGEIAMSKKDLKTLNRLEKHYRGNYEQFRADTFEFSDKAKIIGAVGLLGLLLAIITGSAFGWFVFIVAALAFLLRYLNIIAF